MVARGTLYAVEPSTITLRVGNLVAAPVTPYKYGVALEDGRFHEIVRDGQTLPAVGTYSDFQLTRTIPAGSNEELVVYFVEGMSRLAHDNVKVGELHVVGRDLPRTLREGEKIEVRIHMDESRRLKARVSVPILDLDWPVEFESLIQTAPVPDLQDSMAEARQVVEDLSQTAAANDAPSLINAARELEQAEAVFEEVQKGESGKAEQMASILARVKASLREENAKHGPQVAYQKAVAMIDAAERIAREFEDALGIRIVADLRGEADKALRLEDLNGLKIIEQKADELFWKHYVETDECWIGYVEWLREQRARADDPLAFDAYLRRAEECLAKGDHDGVRLNGIQARTYLPGDTSAPDRFPNARLRAAAS